MIDNQALHQLKELKVLLVLLSLIGVPQIKYMQKGAHSNKPLVPKIKVQLKWLLIVCVELYLYNNDKMLWILVV